ncbi:PAAR domain-containing protein [Pseudomonas sp. NPDC088444]|uniref:PAAR domain-containing protein n=1 Tax=Pseudomonas sp. NPDC088444 TaxID=3364456 RepID=UPI00384C6885
MAEGYFIRKGDKTSCGGVVIDAHSGVNMFGIDHAREGDRVTCGVDGKIYTIVDGIDYIVSHGKRVAGSLDSYSSCPCRATLNPSLFKSSYESKANHVAARSVPGYPPAPMASVRPPPANVQREIMPANLELEEEEEEVEQEQLITLRLGVFFDGTGNNQANSESVAGCMARDVGLENEADAIQQFCAEHGYGLDGGAPDSSYGNDTSNIARLYDLYRDHSDISIEPDAEEAALKVYLEGIGTISGGADDLWGQGTGTGKYGVVARVEQSTSLILESVRLFVRNNPAVKISKIDVDVFGFSRGAAAARHFANDLRKGANSLLAKVLPAGASMFGAGFRWRIQYDIHLNFIGLFDTVPGIVAPLQLDFSPGNARNAGLDLGLPTGCARKIVQLVARDEHRLNFALIRTGNDIVLPGAHSDIGGGYRPRMRERLLVAKPTSSRERKTLPNEQARAVSSARQSVGPLVKRLIEQGIEPKMHIWSEDEARTRDNLTPAYKQVYVMSTLEREVEGDLSKVYLRTMRELAVQHGAPFDAINDRDPRLALPEDLTLITAKVLNYATGRAGALELTAAEEDLLLRRYIHLSASWNAVKERHRTDIRVLFINRPADDHRRIIHGNQ